MCCESCNTAAADAARPCPAARRSDTTFVTDKAAAGNYRVAASPAQGRCLHLRPLAVQQVACICSPGFYGAACDGDLPGGTKCGDGFKTLLEGCDDGNARNGDGCSSGCNVEEGWLCKQSLPRRWFDAVHETAKHVVLHPKQTSVCKMKPGWSCASASANVWQPALAKTGRCAATLIGYGVRGYANFKCYKGTSQTVDALASQPCATRCVRRTYRERNEDFTEYGCFNTATERCGEPVKPSTRDAEVTHCDDCQPPSASGANQLHCVDPCVPVTGSTFCPAWNGKFLVDSSADFEAQPGVNRVQISKTPSAWGHSHFYEFAYGADPAAGAWVGYVLDRQVNSSVNGCTGACRAQGFEYECRVMTCWLRSLSFASNTMFGHGRDIKPFPLGGKLSCANPAFASPEVETCTDYFKCQPAMLAKWASLLKTAALGSAVCARLLDRVALLKAAQAGGGTRLKVHRQDAGEVCAQSNDCAVQTIENTLSEDDVYEGMCRGARCCSMEEQLECVNGDCDGGGKCVCHETWGGGTCERDMTSGGMVFLLYVYYAAVAGGAVVLLLLVWRWRRKRKKRRNRVMETKQEQEAKPKAVGP